MPSRAAGQAWPLQGMAPALLTGSQAVHANLAAIHSTWTDHEIRILIAMRRDHIGRALARAVGLGAFLPQ